MSRKKSWRSPDWEFSQSRKDEAHVRLSLGNHNILVTSINDNFLDASVALLLWFSSGNLRFLYIFLL